MILIEISPTEWFYLNIIESQCSRVFALFKLTGAIFNYAHSLQLATPPGAGSHAVFEKKSMGKGGGLTIIF